MLQEVNSAALHQLPVHLSLSIFMNEHMIAPIFLGSVCILLIPIVLIQSKRKIEYRILGPIASSAHKCPYCNANISKFSQILNATKPFQCNSCLKSIGSAPRENNIVFPFVGSFTGAFLNTVIRNFGISGAIIFVMLSIALCILLYNQKFGGTETNA